MMFNKKIDDISKIFYLFFGAAFFALSLAYISEFVFGFKPCILCLYQRKLFFILAAFSLVGAFLVKNKKWHKVILLISFLVLFLNIALAFYHSGVEMKFFKGLGECTSDFAKKIYNSIEELEKDLLSEEIVRCDKPAFFILGLSMASWNFIYSLSILIFAVGFLIKNNDKK